MIVVNLPAERPALPSSDEYTLSASQLRIYVYLLESGEPRSVREIASALDMPASSVHYHLKKLVSAGIVEKTPNGFRVARRINIEGFVFIWNKLIPRLVLYSFFFIGLVIGVLIVTILERSIDFEEILLLIVSSISAILFLYEGLCLKSRLS